MREAPDEGDALITIGRRATIEDVINIARIGLQEAMEVSEELLHGLATMALDILKQNRITVDHRGEEVALLARLRAVASVDLGWLNQCTGCIRRYTGPPTAPVRL
jgi:hypothetical protein